MTQKDERQEELMRILFNLQLTASVKQTMQQNRERAARDIIKLFTTKDWSKALGIGETE